MPQPVEGVDFLRTGTEVRVNGNAHELFQGMRVVTVTPVHRVARGIIVVQLIGSPVGATEHPIGELDVIK